VRVDCGGGARLTDASEVLVGGSNGDVVIVNVERRSSVAVLHGHDDDVNAICYVNKFGDPNLVASGSDDTVIRVWDRRQPDAVGLLLGHTEGITSLSSRGALLLLLHWLLLLLLLLLHWLLLLHRGVEFTSVALCAAMLADDGWHLLSNGKDSKAKLWDVRRMAPPSTRARDMRRNWDYRWQQPPAAVLHAVHPDDVSVMTYRGHSVLRTLVRAHFSPVETTGQRYIYTGSAVSAAVVCARASDVAMRRVCVLICRGAASCRMAVCLCSTRSPATSCSSCGRTPTS
jgi:WD repeat-containing protein 23